MKYILTIFLGTCLIGKGYSQIYHPFPTDSVSWYEKRKSLPPSCNFDFYDYIFPSGQVTIDGKLYTKLLCNEEFISNNVTPWCGTSQTHVNILYGFFRNDTINKLVYWYDSIYNHEELILYNFNLSIGDTVNPNPTTFGNNPNDTIIVVSIDSIVIGGSYRRSYAISSVGPTAFKDTIIEGIGSQRSLFYRCYYDPMCYSFANTHSKLICYQYQGYQYTPNHGFDCSFHIGIEEPNTSSNHIVQPVGENLYYISNDENHSINLSCYEMLGKLVMKKAINESEYLDFSQMSTGYYLMYLEYDGYPLKPIKFLVQH